MYDKVMCAGLPVENDAHEWTWDEDDPDVGIVGCWVCECCGAVKEGDPPNYDPEDYL